ncbi:MAG TPA: FxLYD domain-containing protein [Bryobacteraceae bacterium]|nr:FxLYD domain-containing protein [Bryobacteraceae bacterium]
MAIDHSLKTPKKARAGVPVAAIIILAMVVIGAAGFWYLDRQSKSMPKDIPVLTAEAKAYVRNLKLGEVEMKAAEAFAGQTLVEILGKITNAGDRRLQSVEINCIFYDPYGQVVLRQRVPIVRSRSGGLAPGETKSFRLPFDEIPDSWNQAMPQLVIAEINFQ